MSSDYFRFARLATIFCSALLATASAVVLGQDSIRLDRLTVGGARLYLIKVDLNDPLIRIDIGLASAGISSSESFAGMVRRRAPLAAVTGTYFDTRSLVPVGTIVRNGSLVHRSAIGTAVSFVRADSGGDGATSVRFADARAGEAYAWDRADCGLRTGPRLLASGSYALDPHREGFHDPGLFGARTRMALGVTPYNKLLLVAVRTPVTFGRLATIMKKLGSVDAVCLDGGSSSAMYYRGRVICSPGRRLTNLVEVRREEPPEAVPGVQLAHAPGTIIDEGPASGTISTRRSQESAVPWEQSPEQPDHCAALAEPPALRLAKRGLALFPVDRAKLTSLKRPKYSQHFVHVAPDVEVVHHLVA